MGRPQPQTELICDNITVAQISYRKIKRQCSRAMNMRYFWIIDPYDGGYLRVQLAPGSEILADYFTKWKSPPSLASTADAATIFRMETSNMIANHSA